MEIKTVSIIGLGALGILFGSQLQKNMPEGDLRIVADGERIERYRRDGVFCNGEPCRFNYVTPDEARSPADLLIFAVKFNGLPAAIEEAKSQAGPQTIIISLLNGISSEGVISETFGCGKVLYSVAQGMDALRVGNRLSYKHMGMICFGGAFPGDKAEEAEAVGRFFDRTGVPYEMVPDMRKRLWGKFMLNVGVNQTVAVFEGDYGDVQHEGPARDTMIAAMREVLTISEKENVLLTEADLAYWLDVLDEVDPRGKPSMRQDLEAGRHSEVGLFSGTVLSLGEKHGLSFPVNRMLYDKIQAIESKF